MQGERRGSTGGERKEMREREGVEGSKGEGNRGGGGC